MSSTDDTNSQQLYKKAPKIYPREVGGRFANLRTLAAWLLLGLYYGVPWLRYDDHQAVLFDLPNRKFHLFGLTLWPQDFIFLAWLFVIAAIALFFFTTLAGRLWCGYACPQTVWTKVFIWMEKFTEGDRNARMKLDKSPLSWRKVRIKLSKHALWVAFALYTGFTFVGFFTPITEVWTRLVSVSLGPWETFWIVFYSFATYGNAGWLREQICIYMCPYGRFQGVMFDKDTLIIAYDEARGEPRGARKRHQPDLAQSIAVQQDLSPASSGVMHYAPSLAVPSAPELPAKNAKELGDCIDCKQCVVVCPTGIDIREGLQVECIGCAACIDACDEVMDKMGYARGLVRYSSDHAMKGGQTSVVRPRVLLYGLLLVGMLVAFGLALAWRSPLAFDILRDRNRLYNITPMGLVQNVYTLKIMNKDQRDHRYRISVSGVHDVSIEGRTEVKVHAGEVLSVPLRLAIDPADLRQTTSEIQFSVQSIDVPEQRAEGSSKFIRPAGSRR